MKSGADEFGSIVLLEINFPELERFKEQVIENIVMGLQTIAIDNYNFDYNAGQKESIHFPLINASQIVAKTQNEQSYYFYLAVKSGSKIECKESDSVYKVDKCMTLDYFINYVICYFDRTCSSNFSLKMFENISLLYKYIQYTKSATEDYSWLCLKIKKHENYPQLNFADIALILRCMEEFISIFQEYYHNATFINTTQVEAMLNSYCLNLSAKLENYEIIKRA